MMFLLQEKIHDWMINWRHRKVFRTNDLTSMDILWMLVIAVLFSGSVAGFGFLAFRTKLSELISFWFPSMLITSGLLAFPEMHWLQRVILVLTYIATCGSLNLISPSFPRIIGLLVARLVEVSCTTVLLQWILQRRCPTGPWIRVNFQGLPQVLLVCFMFMLSAVLSGLVAAMTAILTRGPMSFGHYFLVWFAGDVYLSFVFVPFLLIFKFDVLECWPRWSYELVANWRKMAGCFLLLAAAPLPTWISYRFITLESRLGIGLDFVLLLVIVSIWLGGLLAASATLFSAGIATVVFLFKPVDPQSPWATASSIGETALIFTLNSFIAMIFATLLRERDFALKTIEDTYQSRTREIEYTMQVLQESKLNTEKLYREKSRFISFLCHELRNPMHAIMNLVEEDIAMMKEVTPHLKSNSIETLMSQVQFYSDNCQLSSIASFCTYMVSLLTDVLDFDKLQNNAVSINKSLFMLHDEIQALKNRTVAYFRRKQLAFDVCISDRVPMRINTDKVKLLQVMQNLLSNAYKFTPEGGNIGLHLDCESLPSLRPSSRSSSDSPSENEDIMKLTVTVSDTGPGLSEEQIKMIFESYKQLPQDITENMGSGLGLTITKSLVELLGGEISVSSVLGQGASFRFWIPAELSYEEHETSQKYQFAPSQQEFLGGTVSTEEVRVNIPDGESAASPSTTALQRFLVVDDSQMNRMVLKKMLSRILPETMIVDEAVDGQDALHKASTNDYNMIFMDIVMPNMDGYNASEAIRALHEKEQRAIRPIIVAATGNVNANGEFMQKAKEYGMDDALSKPFTAQQLISLLKKYDLTIK